MSGYVDYETQERIWKDSAIWYKDVIRNNGFKANDKNS
jgi:beta-glucosidase